MTDIKQNLILFIVGDAYKRNIIKGFKNSPEQNFSQWIIRGSNPVTTSLCGVDFKLHPQGWGVGKKHKF